MRLLLSMLMAAAVAFVSGGTGPASAADYRLLRLDGKLVKWGAPRFGAGATLTYAVARSNMDFPQARNCGKIKSIEPALRRSGIERRAFERELEAAFRAWERIANVRFRRIANARSADIVIGAQRRPRGRAYANVTYDKAATKTGIHRIEKSLICLNPEHGWKIGFDGDLEVYDLRFTFMHEIGHILGLDHETAEGDQLMGFAYHEDFRAPQPGDIAGVGRLYGRQPAAPQLAGGPVPEPESGRPDPAHERTPALSLGRPQRR